LISNDGHADDEDDDPSQQPLVQWLTRKLPFVSTYDEKGAFFVRVPVDEHGEVVCPEEPGGAAARPPPGEALRSSRRAWP